MDRNTIYERLEDAVARLNEERHTERIDLDEYAIVIALHATRMVNHAKGGNKTLASAELLELMALAICCAENFGIPKATAP